MNFDQQTIRLNEKDNTVTVLKDIQAGTYRSEKLNITITLTEQVQAGFKICIQTIPAGEPVYKYGHRIGTATENINQGKMIHIHNIRSNVKNED